MKRIGYYVVQILEYVFAFMFIQGGIGALTPENLPNPSGFIGALAEPWVVVAYGVSWICMGVGLLAGKWFKWRKTHGYSLLAMYLTCVYVYCLSLAITGPSWDQLSSILVGFGTAALYLRWKYHIKQPKEDEI